MRQDAADVNLLRIVVDSSNYPGHVAADIKEGELHDFTSAAGLAFRMDFSKLAKRFARNDAHSTRPDERRSPQRQETYP
jgi:hypothetical protein